MRIVRSKDGIALISEHDGRLLVALLVLEILLLGGILAFVASYLQDPDALLVPALASLALIVWTALQIKDDVRVTIDLASREGRVVRISPVVGERTSASFSIDEIEHLALQQTVERMLGQTRWREYVVAVELRDGARHVLSTRGPLLAYQENVAAFCRAAGLGARVIRLAGA